MIQLAFESAFDPFHAAFRILRQLEFRGGAAISVARLKILDTYVAEPRRCLDIRVPPGLKKKAKLAAACQPPTYGARPSAGAMFNRMSPMQDAAIQTLAFQGFVDADSFAQGLAMRTDTALPENLAARILQVNVSQNDLMTFLLNDLAAIDFNGPNGLKARTSLGEFRYDIV